MRDRILIAEDEPDLLQGLGRIIEMEMDCDILLADSGRKAMQILKQEHIDLLLTDIRMPDIDGMELLRTVHRKDPLVTVVVMTAYGSIEQAVQAIKCGAYDFITKPFDEKQMLHVLQKGLERNRLVRENQRLQREISGKPDFQEMIGISESMQKVFETIRMLGRTDVTVLILGESGTGKEMAAKAIHGASSRSGRKMITVNCPGLPENILESELFGYRKGAFTNAAADKPGLFEVADGSSIFLDEIGDISIPLQTKLLRVLQEKEIKPLGDTRTRIVDVRIIASTNQDLEAKIVEGSFRQDLYFRLNVARLMMPPLREHREDIPLLVDHFLKKSALELNVDAKTIRPDVLNRLMMNAWPGNVRELENAIKGLTATVSEPEINTSHLPGSDTGRRFDFSENELNTSYQELKDQVLENFTTTYVERMLERTGGNVSLAADMSKMKRQSLQKIIRRYGIDPNKFRL